ncbi:NUDIX domain-containing protein [Bacillus daqingensis]|uniref:NUDIX domain-containing protein n=1 Tax=Bacillus daqingensis TaxID=872396 RepID=A0ABV9NTP7_9BACI
MEIWDLLDQEGKKTGQTIQRGKPLPEGYYHLVVHTWIVDQDHVLITRRALEKPHPGMWETPGGSALSGESSREAAVREVKEEIGMELELSKLDKLKRTWHDSYVHDIWFVERPFSLERLDLQREEVSEARRIKLETLHEWIRQDCLITGLQASANEMVERAGK